MTVYIFRGPSRTCAYARSLSPALERQLTLSPQGGAYDVRVTVSDRFWSKVDIRSADECWPWRCGRDAGGYGFFYFEGRKHRAHRWLLGHLRGRPLVGGRSGVEDGCHRCDNPPCCNPAHLYVGTRKRNVADAIERKRLWQLRKDTCPAGHRYDRIRPDGARKCSQCHNAESRARKRRIRDRRRTRSQVALTTEHV